MISILSVFPPYRGGISKFSDYLYRHLSQRTQVSAFNFTRLYPPVLFPGKSQYLPDGQPENYARRVLHAYNPFNWKSAAREILQSQPNHLIITYWHPFFAPAFLRIISFLKKKQPKLKIHLLAHNVMPHETFPFGRVLSQKLLNRADKVYLLSAKSLEETQSLNINTPTQTLFHPVYEQEFPADSISELRKKYAIQADEHVFLFFGLIRKYKGLDIFIESLNQLDLETHKIRPVIAGEFYADKSDFLQAINPEHRHRYLIIDRFVSDKEMAELFTLSDALVMPYRSATQSGILANAINFHLPAIVSDLKGLTEHIEHGKTAWVVEPENADALKKALLSFTNPKVIDKLKTALKPLKQQLSWTNFTGQLLSEINKENP